jgi:hypothetical protein
MAVTDFGAKKYRVSAQALLTFGISWLLSTPALGSQIQRLQGHVPPAVAGLHATGELQKSQRLDLVIGLPLRNQSDLNAMLQRLYDPASPDYHKFLTPAQFTEQFGPTESDYLALITFAKSNNLTITRTHPNRTLLNVNGAVADIEKAFNVTLHLYNHPTEGRTFYAPDTEPSLALDVSVLTVGGLNNYSLPRPMNLRRSSGASAGNAVPLTGSGPNGNYMGNDFRAAYVPGVSLTGSGQTVGLLEFDGYVANDIASYESQAGLPAVPLNNVLLDSYDGSAGQNSAEVSLDIEMAVSMAPGLSSVVVYEDSPSALTGNTVLNEMANPSQGEPLPFQLSASWTFPTDASTELIFQQFAAQGQSYFNASGDSDAYATPASVPTPAGDTNITSVGGTTLTTSGPGGSWQSEKAWNWGFNANTGEYVGTGGGVTSFPIPSWQQGIDMSVNQGSTTSRNIPDVALTADNVWVIYGNGQTGAFGGTSCAAPLWAAFIALVNQQAQSYGKPPAGFVNPAIYALGKGPSYATSFHDITTGNNTGGSSPNLYYAVAGYDLCTGWGTPNGSGLINALVSDTLSITPPFGFTSTGYPGGPFSVTNQTFTLTNLSTTSLTWALGNTSAWLNASTTSGLLATGGSAAVVVSLNAAAYSLPVGTNTSTVWFTNLQDSVVQSRQFTLQVQRPPDPLQIIPSSGFASSGYVGGPFTVANQSFTLTNISAGAVNWTLANTSLWLNASSAGGSLAPATAATLTISLNSTVTSLAPGNYADTIWFTNLNDSVAQGRLFNLTVFSLNLVQNGGFETHDFSGWTESGSASAIAGMLVVSNVHYVHSGRYGAALGAQYSLGYISQTLATFPGQLYLLSFWLSSTNGLVPNQFTVTWDGTTLFNQSNLPKFGWTNLTFMVTAGSSSTVLQFGALDQPSFLGLDDVNVLPIVPPQFRNVSRVSGTFNCQWIALAGLSYQVQYKTNLVQSTWANLGIPITATNSLASFSDSSSDQSRFYRILISP